MTRNIVKSRRSGGPSSLEGKRVASQNSLKTGAYSLQPILPGENPEELKELEQLFIQDFQPQGLAEVTVVRSLVLIAWKKLRLEKLEYHYLRDKLTAPFDVFEFDAMQIQDCPDIVAHYLVNADLINACDGALAKECVRACNYLQELGWTEGELKYITKQFPKAFAKLHEMMLAECELEKITISEMATIRYSFSAPKQPIQVVIEKLLEQALADVWVFDNKDRLLDAHRKILDKRLSAALQFDRTGRAAEDLERSFFKTLAELRKQQEWLTRHEFIDIETRALDKS